METASLSMPYLVLLLCYSAQAADGAVPCAVNGVARGLFSHFWRAPSAKRALRAEKHAFGKRTIKTCPLPC